jgi:hypothetical protein
MKYRFLCIFSFLLFFPSLSWGAYWIVDFSGTPEEYRLAREGKQIEIKLLMVLKTGDKLEINHKDKDGKLVLVREDNSRIILTNQDSPFTVSEAQEPPGIIDNLTSLFSEWKHGTKSIVARTRGPTPVLLGTSDVENFIFPGTNVLVAHWRGGRPPFQIQLLDASYGVVAENTDIHAYSAQLTDLSLAPGEYGLVVKGWKASTYTAIKVVKPEEKPQILMEIVESRSPDKVKDSFSVLALSSRQEWLFQALQLAEKNNLQDLKQDILNGNVPDRFKSPQF